MTLASYVLSDSAKKPHPKTQWSFERKKCFHNVKIKRKRVSGYTMMSDHNEGFFGCNPCPKHITGESHVHLYFVNFLKESVLQNERLETLENFSNDMILSVLERGDLRAYFKSHSKL